MRRPKRTWHRPAPLCRKPTRPAAWNTRLRVSEAESAVAAAKLRLRISREARSIPETAVVITQDPPPHRRVKPGSSVTATVEIAPRTALVPNLVGLAMPTAEDRLGPSL